VISKNDLYERKWHGEVISVNNTAVRAEAEIQLYAYGSTVVITVHSTFFEFKAGECVVIKISENNEVVVKNYDDELYFGTPVSKSNGLLMSIHCKKNRGARYWNRFNILRDLKLKDCDSCKQDICILNVGNCGYVPKKGSMKVRKCILRRWK
jgi:hypothetical protein